uniref:Uncharacterized protein n=1 Tax=Mastacembelus armatus TaxID=205130 RepID=A0A3Q3KZN7_9TELE
ISSTFISISDVPEFGGDPPSTAVKMSWIYGFFSRSRDFCSTNSGDILSPLLCVSRLKYSFGLSLYILTPFLPTSASLASDKANLDPGTVFSAMSSICDFVLKVGEWSFTSFTSISRR